MLLLDQIAEARITEAISRGEFDNLPGQGQPVLLDNDPLIPESLRVAYRLLKNSGHLPPEMETRREIRSLEQLLAITEDRTERYQARKRLNYLFMTLESGRKPSGNLAMQRQQHYYNKLLHHLEQE